MSKINDKANDKAKITKREVKEQGYDEVPYVSYPFSYATPNSLRSVAKLFAIDAPRLENCRVLEMGSSEGTNLLKFAIDYPNAEVIGIDLSKIQVDNGIAKIKEMGLKNYTLKHMSITDLDEKMGKFDYIICHGVYSWVPDFVQDAILGKCNELLTDKGLAFVSCNVNPGWNMQHTIRDLMLFHSKNFSNIQDQIQQARLALDFICDALEGSDTPYARFMSNVAQDLRTKKDNYLRHEYLADENKPCYFHEFAAELHKHNLQYIGDTDIQRLFLGNLPTKARDALSTVNDVIKTGQYTDFISNTTFRCNVIAKANVVPNREITPDRITDLLFHGEIAAAKKITKDDIMSSDLIEFYAKNIRDLSIKVNLPIAKALMHSLMNAIEPLTLDEIMTIIAEDFPELKSDIKQQMPVLANTISRLIFAGYLGYFADKPKFTSKLSDKPKIHDVNLYRLKKDQYDDSYLWVTTGSNDMAKLEDMYHNILPLFDGNNTQEQIIEKIFEAFKSGKLQAQQEGNKNVDDQELLKKFSAELFEQISRLLLNNWLLVS